MLTGIRRTQMQDVPKPEVLHGHDVLVKVGAVGICGSDAHYYTWGRIGSQTVHYPFTVGHECAGIVGGVGKGVTRVRPGDRVFVEPAMSCGKCDQCLSGRPHTCRNIRFLGCPGQANGCLSEFIVMPEECCFPLRDGTRLEYAALAEPLSIGLYSVSLFDRTKGATVGILGAGPIGLSVLLSAVRGGAKTIFVTDKLDERVHLARIHGAAWAGNPTNTDIVRGIKNAEPLLLDVVFECCGEQEALDQAVEILKPGGKLMIVGIPEPDRISFNIEALRRKEIGIQNVRRQNGCVRPALDVIENGEVAVDFLITHRFSLDRTQEAFDLVAEHADGVIKAMVLM